MTSSKDSLPIALKCLAQAVLAVILEVSAPAASGPDDARLQEILDTPDEQVFTGKFSHLLLEISAPQIRAFRESLEQGMVKQTLARRHSWKALGLADMRWAELDTPGFAAACKEGKMQDPHNGQLYAVMRQMESDVESSIRLYRDFGLDRNKNYWPPEFLTALAAKDPQRAVALFKELLEARRSTGDVTAIIRVWADHDPDAAWLAIANFPKTQQDELRPYWHALVCAAAARKDPAHARRLLDSVGSAADRSRIQDLFMRQLGVSDAVLALDFARKADTPGTWITFTLSVCYGTDDETLLRLLEVLPKEVLQPCLVAYFTRNENPLLPPLRHARLLPALPDKELRRAVILAITATKTDSNSSLPAAVADAAIAYGLDILSDKTPDLQRKLLFNAMLIKRPDVVLPWMFKLREVEWDEFASAATRCWPQARLAEATRRFIVSDNPRESAFGCKLAERWWRSDPVGAFPDVIAKLGMLLANNMDCKQMLTACGGDAKRVEALLATIPDRDARQTALTNFQQEMVEYLPPREALASLLAMLEQQDIRKLDGATGCVTGRKDPEMDALICGIPDSRQKDRDHLVAKRACHLASTGEEERALTLWRSVRDDAVLLTSVLLLNHYGVSVRLKDWADLLEMVAARPASSGKTPAIEELSRACVRYARDQALAIAGKTSSVELRNCLLVEIARRVQDKKLFVSGMDLVRRLPEDQENAEVHKAWRDVEACLDPVSAWQQAVKIGLETPDGLQLGRRVMERMARDEPKAALALLMKAGTFALREEFLSLITKGLATKDPASVFRIACDMPDRSGRETLLLAVSEWSKIDCKAACLACLQVIARDSSRRLLDIPLGIWLQSDADAAVLWIKGLADPAVRTIYLRYAAVRILSDNPEMSAGLYLDSPPDDASAALAGIISNQLAKDDYAKGCGFLLKVAREIPVGGVRSAWQEILVRWCEIDPATASAFLISQEKSPLTDFLNAGLGEKLLPRFKVPLAQWAHTPLLVTHPEDGMDAPVRQPKSLSALPSGSGREMMFAMEHGNLEGLARSIASGGEIPLELTDAFIQQEPGKSPLAANLAALNVALLQRDPAQALLAAIQLPGPEYDPLVCRILTSFASPIAADAAIKLIPNPADRQRVQAWRECVDIK